jgi:plastocyanin
MNRRVTVAIAATAAVGLPALVLAPAASAAKKKNTIQIVGGISIEINKGIKDNQRFISPLGKVKSGATVKVVNRKTPDPHTISFAAKQFLPGDSFEEFETAVFPLLGQAHGVPEDDPNGEPSIFVVDNGVEVPEGGTLEADTVFTDTVMGDSAFIAPGQKSFSFKVTADAGSTLNFFCAVHPWMQGKIRVK